MAGVPLSRAAAFGVCVAAVSLVAVAQMTSHVSRTGERARRRRRARLMDAGELRPGDQVAVTSSLAWTLWVPQAFEVSWTELELFNPGQPAAAARDDRGRGGVAGRAARAASWPQAPAGWRIVASDQAAGWVVWRKG